MSQANVGAPTPRRSNRLSTKASSVADSAVTNATPGGTRQRKGPLTKVKARKSNAYGASGRVGAAEALSLPTTGFATAFQSQRGSAFARDDEDDDQDDDEEEEEDETDELNASTTHTRVARDSSSRQPSTPPRLSSRADGLSFLESDSNLQSEDDLTSIGNTSKSFGPMHEAGMLMPQSNRFQHTILNTRRTVQAQASSTPVAPRAQRTPATQPASMQPPTRPNGRGVFGQATGRQQSEAQVQLQPGSRSTPQDQQAQDRRPHGKGPQSVTNWLDDVDGSSVHGSGSAWPYRKYLSGLLWGLLLIAASSVLTIYLAKTPGLPESHSSTGGLGSAFLSRVSYTYDKIVDFVQPPLPPPEMTEQEKKAAFIAGEDNILWDRMDHMYKTLQNRMNTVNGTVDDMTSVIHGLRDQLPPFLVVRQHVNGRSEISDEFWLALLDKQKRKDNSPEWQEFLERTSQRLEALFNNHHERSDTDSYARAVSRQEFVKEIERQYETIATRVDKKVVELFKAQRDEIKTIVETEAKKKVVDGLRLQSLAQGILVSNYELHLRSPNYFSPGLGAFVDHKLTSSTYGDDPGWFRKVTTSPIIRSPKTALYGWNEPGDCWCATPSPGEHNQAQLTVAIGRPMTPKKVTIEHVPMSMVPGRKLANAPRTTEVWVETDDALNYHYSEHQASCSPGIPGWKCLGSFKYNIHAENHVQTFELAAEPSKPIQKAMLRVVNNWGADHTCLYQVRLHGSDAQPDFDHQVRLNDE